MSNPFDKPNQDLPGNNPVDPDYGVDTPGRPDQDLPGRDRPVDPDFGKPAPPNRPDQGLPGRGPRPNQDLPDTPSAEPREARAREKPISMQVREVLRNYDNMESNIPVTHPYWKLKYQQQR